MIQRTVFQLLLFGSWGWLSACSAFADDGGAASVSHMPDYRSDVLPLLQKAGCSQLGCHGAFRGQGGFALSRFGRSPAADFEQLLSAQRVVPGRPADSRLLAMVSGREEHTGGVLFEESSWEYRLLRDWITQGAVAKETRSDVIELSIQPESMDLTVGDPDVSLSVVAELNDGSHRDVTQLCSFETLNPGICSVGDSGFVSAGDEVGIGQVRVRFLTHSAAADIYRAANNQQGRVASKDRDTDKQSNISAGLDRAVEAKLARLNLGTGGRCSDTEFLRRVALDLSGRLPTVDLSRRYHTHAAATRRQWLVETLLNSDDFTDYWTAWIARLTGCDERLLRNTSQIWIGLSAQDQARLWQEWVRHRVAQDRPLHEIVSGSLLAQDREPGQSWSEYLQESDRLRSQGPVSDALVAEYASRSTNPLFFAPYRFTGGVTEVVADRLLGQSVGCANCHDHPHEIFTQSDYRALKAVFQDTEYRHAKNERTATFKSAMFFMIAAFGVLGGFVFRAIRLRKTWLLLAVSISSGCIGAVGVFVSFSYWHLLVAGARAMLPGETIAALCQRTGLTIGPICVLSGLVATFCCTAFVWTSSIVRRASLRRSLRALAISFVAVFSTLTVLDGWYLSSQPTDGHYREGLANAVRRNVYDWLGMPRSGAVELAFQSPKRRAVTPAIPSGPELNCGVEQDPRYLLMDELKSGPQPQLARSFVNRVWARIFGAGIVEPLDGFAANRKPVHDDLLKLLTSHFVNNEWSIRTLVRAIVMSDTYQRAAAGNQSTAVAAPGLFRCFEVRCLDEVQLVSSIAAVAGSAGVGDGDSELIRKKVAGMSANMTGAQNGMAMDRSESEVDMQMMTANAASDAQPLSADCCQSRPGLGRLERNIQGRILRVGENDSRRITLELALLLTGSGEIEAWLQRPEGRIRKWIHEGLTDQERLHELYLQAYCRWPSQDEEGRLLRLIDEHKLAADEVSVWTDVVWAVINSEEFLTIR